jgi:hypothetical protein
MALIKAPGGTAQRMQARLKAVEMLVRDDPALQSHKSGAGDNDRFASAERSSWRA